MTNDSIKIRECESVEDLSECVALQREVFGLPDLEISPVRHLIVTKHAGGFTLGAFAAEKLVGFVLSVPAFLGEERFFYSHMMAVKKDFQSYGIGARLKWAQRTEALRRDVKFIKWTFQPVQARNAYFNLEKLGVLIKEYKPNFYGTDYSTSSDQTKNTGLDSDRLFAEWHLESEKVKRLEISESCAETDEIARKIEIPNDWNGLVKSDVRKAIDEQTRVKAEFQKAFAEKLICRSFERSETNPKYLLFRESNRDK
jgi:predicted GNAT superfamily acetyltransferase